VFEDTKGVMRISRSKNRQYNEQSSRTQMMPQHTCLTSMTSMLLSLLFLHRLFDIRELGNNHLLGNPTYTSTTLSKEEIQNNLVLLCVPLEFQPKMKNWISSLHCIP